MTIDGVNVSAYGAHQQHVEFGFHGISNDSAWIRSAILPHMSKNVIDFKKISVEVIVKPLASQASMHPRDAIRLNTSNLLASLLGPVDLVLDNFSHTFHVILTDHKTNELSMRRFHKVTLEFSGYEYGPQVSESGTNTVTINNPGNIISPLRLQITPAATASNVTITGACPDPVTGEDAVITIASVTANRKIVLDGANGIFWEGNQSTLKTGLTIAALPGVKPGSTTITCSQTGAALTATILPLYM